MYVCMYICIYSVHVCMYIYISFLQTLKNVHLESNLLRTEVSLHQREEDIRGLEERNLRLQNEVKQLRMASSKAIKQFERRTKEGTIYLYLSNIRTVYIYLFICYCVSICVIKHLKV